MVRRVKNNAWNEVFALVLLGVGTLLFLALISYSPRDLLPSRLGSSEFAGVGRLDQSLSARFDRVAPRG